MLSPWNMSNIPKRQDGQKMLEQEAVLKYQLPRVNVVKEPEKLLAGGGVKHLFLSEKT